MQASSLYDLTPAARLMLMGVVIALGPLAWVWLRNPQAAPARRLQALTLLTLFLTFDLVLFGAFTRLTDSGLGCPDWPGCYGNASPVGAHADIAAAQSAMPTGPVTHGKAWVEMIHRYLATGVGVLILTLTVASWRNHKRRQRGHDSAERGGYLERRRAAPRREGPLGGQRGHDSAERGGHISPWWPTLTLLWVCLQGAFGALTVTMKLFPAIVTLHLLGGIGLLILLCLQAVRFQQASGAMQPQPLSRGLRAALWLAFALVLAQTSLGGWVSTNYAVLACSEFPMCQGSWWPSMDFRQGFEIWRELGRSQDGGHIGFAALTAIHYSHRLAAYAVLAVLALLAWRLRRSGRLKAQALWIAGLALWQFATGLSNVVLDWPLVAAVSHTGGAAALAVVLTWALCASRAATQNDHHRVPEASADAPRPPASRLAA